MGLSADEIDERVAELEAFDLHLVAVFFDEEGYEDFARGGFCRG
jgi:hypothetical protein